MNEKLPPTLPLDRVTTSPAVELVDPMINIGHVVRAHRGAGLRLGPDRILLSAYYTADVGSVSVDLTLTPAMIVHLANELLTDDERAYIKHPSTDEAYNDLMIRMGRGVSADEAAR